MKSIKNKFKTKYYYNKKFEMSAYSRCDYQLVNPKNKTKHLYFNFKSGTWRLHIINKCYFMSSKSVKKIF